MIQDKDQTPRTPSKKQQAALHLGQVLNVQVELAPEGENQPEAGSALAKLVEGSSLSAPGREQALICHRNAEMVANEAAAQGEILAKLGQMASEPPLSDSSKTADDLANAKESLRAIEICKKLINPLLPKVENALTDALKQTQAPLLKKGTGKAAVMRQNLEAQRSYNETVLASSSADRDAVSKYALQAAEAGKKITALHAAWRKSVEQYQRNAEAERKKQQAIDASRRACETAEKAYEEAEQDKLLDQVKSHGIPAPDLNGLVSAMREAAKKQEWQTAGATAGKLSAQITRLRNTITWVEQVKSDYENAKQQTQGRLKQLDSRFEAAKVYDSSQLETLRSLLRDANSQATGKDWLTAAQTLADFETKCKEATDEADNFDHYSGGTDPRLLTGTILDVFKKLGKGRTNHDALVELENAYQVQCLVKRNDWLTELGIAGANVKVGTASDHYTTFNDSVPVGTDVSVHGCRPDNVGATGVCAQLFETVTPFARIHATFVRGDDRYHRYWSRVAATYSNNVTAATPANVLDPLSARYNKMVDDMVTKTIQVIKVHGRIGANRNGPKI